MVSVNATAAYCRAALIMLHDYLGTMGNLKAVEGSTVAGISNQSRKYQSERLRNSEATSVKSGNSAHHLRPRWTHNHRRFANLSVVHRQLHLHQESSSTTSRDHHRLHSDVTIPNYDAAIALPVLYNEKIPLRDRDTSISPSSRPVLYLHRGATPGDRRNQLPIARAKEASADSRDQGTGA